MHFGGSWDAAQPTSAEDARRAVEAFATAYELGWRLFDHADIYCGGKSEALFPQVLRDAGVSREQILIQTKCGIRMASADSPHRFDFRPEYIIASVEGSLKRLQTDYIDILLLHRPDILLEPQAIIDAFGQLRDAGKVRHFGVSNFTPSLLELMRVAGFQPVANQVELNLLKTSLLDSMVVSDEGQPMAGHPADGTLEYHRIHGISTQAWAPLAYGYPVGRKPDWDAARVQQLAQVVERIAAKYEVPGNAVVIAWLLRHPAAIMPIIGTRDPQRLRDCHRALELELSHEDWYALFLAGRGRKLP
jgi:predicted oxidoreductase